MQPSPVWVSVGGTEDRRISLPEPFDSSTPINEGSNKKQFLQGRRRQRQVHSRCKNKRSPSERNCCAHTHTHSLPIFSFSPFFFLFPFPRSDSYKLEEQLTNQGGATWQWRWVVVIDIIARLLDYASIYSHITPLLCIFAYPPTVIWASNDRQKLCRTFEENTKVYEIVSRDTVAYACLGNCVT